MIFRTLETLDIALKVLMVELERICIRYNPSWYNLPMFEVSHHAGLAASSLYLKGKTALDVGSLLRLRRITQQSSLLGHL
ncbi:hypothetical protein [Candidatus Nitrospira salsa]